MTDNVSYIIAMNIYRALGGQQSGFESVEDVYTAVDEIYSAGGGRIVVEPIKKKVSTGGVYTYNNENVTGYKPVEFEVDIKEGYDYSGLGYSDEFIEKIRKYEKGYIEAAKNYLDTGKFDNTSAYNGIYLISDMPLCGNSTYYKKRMAAFPHVVPDYTFEWTNSNDTMYNNIFRDGHHKSVMLAGKWKLPNYNDLLNFGMDSKIKEIEGLDAPSLTNSLSFENTYTLEKLGDINVPSLTTAKNLFNMCYNLISIDSLTTSSVLTSCEYMFYGCSNLTSVPLFDTSGVTTMWQMFQNCSSLTVIPQFNTSNVTDMMNMFYGCSNLTSVPELDCSNTTNIYQMFSKCPKITDFGGWKNLGMQEKLYNLSNVVVSLRTTSNLTHDSLMNIINKLYDRAAAGYSILQIVLSADNLNKLSDEEKAIATNKGWIIS